MEHLVKRKADISFASSTRRQTRIGNKGGFTQSRIGANPFKLNKNGAPIMAKRGDIIWVMESNYGVYAKHKIKRISSTFRINSLDSLDSVRRSFSVGFQMQSDYWESQEKKLLKAIDRNKSLHFVHIETEIVEDIEDFPIITPKGMASSWIFLTKERKDKLFALKGKKSCEEYIVESDIANYGNITVGVKHKVLSIWKYKRIDGKPVDIEPFDFDHYIPKSLGGPGIFPENIIPVDASANRYKSNRIPKALVIIGKKYNIKGISEKIVSQWDSDIKSSRNPKSQYQKQLTAQITSIVKSWDVAKQRKFYFDVLNEGFPNHDIKDKYIKAGYTTPK